MGLESCTCEKCVKACERIPGWMTPDEARKAIDAGFAGRLMLDWWIEQNGEELFVLTPAVVGREGGQSAWWPGGRCTFLRDSRCEIHSSGFKPIHCRLALLCDDTVNEKAFVDPKGDVAKLWHTETGRALIEKWRALMDAANPAHIDSGYDALNVSPAVIAGG